jgi:hypothetical protein
MDPFTVAGIVALVLVGIFNKTGEVIAEGSIEQLKQRLSQKSPETLKQLQSASEGDAESLRQPIEVMATLIEEDATLKQLAETVAKENADKQPQADKTINILKNAGIVANAGSKVKIGTLNQTVY